MSEYTGSRSLDGVDFWAMERDGPQLHVVARSHSPNYAHCLLMQKQVCRCLLLNVHRWAVGQYSTEPFLVSAGDTQLPGPLPEENTPPAVGSQQAGRVQTNNKKTRHIRRISKPYSLKVTACSLDGAMLPR